MQARRPFTVPLERYVILPALIAGFALACLNYMSDTRLPNMAYLAFALLQLGVVALQVFRRNLLTATMGLCLTLILLFAVVLERAPFKDFDYGMTHVVYRAGLISTSYAVLLASTCLYHVVTLRFVPDRSWIWQPADLAERSFGKATTWAFLIVGNLLLAVTIPGDFITNVSYGTAAYYDRSGFAAGNGGVALLGCLLVTFTVVSASRLYGFDSTRFKIACFLALASMMYFRILRGSRGGAIGLFATFAFLYYMNSKLRPWKRTVVLVSASALVLLVFNLLAEVRATAHRAGFAVAFDRSVSSSFTLLDHPMQLNLLPQMYWHLLHCVDLYQMNVRLNGQTFVDLLPEAIPEDVSKFLGIARPISASWRLAAYRIHGGGMFVIAEGFWNFGFPGALFVAGVLALIAMKLEHWYREQEPILSCSYFAFLGTFGFGLYYGLQGFARAFEMSLVLALTMRFFMKYFRRRVERRRRLLVSMAEAGIPIAGR